MKDGIHLDFDERLYHNGPPCSEDNGHKFAFDDDGRFVCSHCGEEESISKSGLWDLYGRTPRHYRFAPPKEHMPHLDFGKALHLAVLEPELFETKAVQGPVDRRGNKWKDALGAIEDGQILLISDNYDDCYTVQSEAWKHPVVKKLATETSIFEASAFWHHERTGLQCRCRPDLVVPKMKLMVDLKTTADASAWNWARTAGNLGYHVQEGMYTEGWNKAGGDPTEAFIFVVIEQKAPFCTAVYELPPHAAEEGRMVMERALDRYKECLESNKWPGYPERVVELDIPKFSYRESEPPEL